ncbi:MAG TPA: nuclear transport factor 2 family protein [Flavobacterium sp.]|nr:nuclear transport factor 2 family protein [Flavobacterium sp.]
MKKIILLFFTCSIGFAQDVEKAAIGSLLDLWHQAAAEARFKPYFGMMSADAVYIGTDASEVWTRKEFEDFAKPYFDRGKAWDFQSVRRNIYVQGDVAWFDELLDTKTNMKLCRGSGVVKKVDGQWKIAHYVLSMTIPNDITRQVVPMKTAIEDAYLSKLKP